MRILRRFHLLITARELPLLILVGRTRANDTDDCDESVNLSHVRHLAEADHRGTFNMMHSAGAAAGDHLPHFWIFPRFEADEVSSDTALLKRFLRVTHHRQTALRENIHLHET